MATFDLGRVTPLYKGDYSASASYELNDVVLYNGNLYWHVQATATVGILPTDTTVWKLAFAGGGVRADVLLVTVISNETSNMTDKSYAEIIEAWNVGKVVRLYFSDFGGEIDMTARGEIGTTDEYLMAILPEISGSQVEYVVVTMIKGATDSDMMSVHLQL